jgi:hypothetical protein
MEGILPGDHHGGTLKKKKKKMAPLGNKESLKVSGWLRNWLFPELQLRIWPQGKDTNLIFKSAVIHNM